MQPTLYLTSCTQTLLLCFCSFSQYHHNPTTSSFYHTMKIFEWMHSKITLRHTHTHKTENPASDFVDSVQNLNHQKEEFSDWPHGLLAIGTFGNNNNNDDRPQQEELAVEEAGQLQSELSLIMYDQQGFEAERTTKDLHRSTSLVVGIGKDNKECLDCPRGSGLNGKKSFSFLLKKVFACRGGFTPAPSLKDQITDSTMEKLLRSILHKKIYPQSSASRLSAKKYLENRHKKTEEEHGEGSKWVQTDSEYIVLEI